MKQRVVLYVLCEKMANIQIERMLNSQNAGK